MLLKLPNSRKSQATMLSYILLISIVIGLSVGVYAFLKLYVQEGTVPECQDDVFLVLANYSCDSSSDTLAINLKNQGYHNIDGFILKISTKDDSIPILDLNADEMAALGDGRYDFNLVSGPLEPGKSKTINFDYQAQEYSAIKEIKIEPFQYTEIQGKKRIALCNEAIITEKLINCN